MMSALVNLLPSWTDIIKIPLIMLIAALSVSVIVVAARFLIKLLMKAFSDFFHKRQT